MKSIRRICTTLLAILALVAMPLTLTGCSKSDEKSSKDEAPAAEKSTDEKATAEHPADHPADHPE